MIDDTFYNGIIRVPLATPGFRTVYRHSGPDWQDAEAVFFIHGSLASGRWFEPAMASLEELMPGKYACYAPDLRSHGEADPLPIFGMESLADDMLAVLDTLGIRQAHVVGWSLGGGVATLLALNHPQRCLSLTLVSAVAPTGLPTLVPANRHLLGEAIGRGQLDVVAKILKAAHFRHGRFPTNDSPPGNALTSYLVQTALQAQNYPGDEERGEGSAVAMQRFNVAERSRAAQVKVLSLHGDADPLISNEYFAALQESWPPALFSEIVFEGSSHAPHVEQPRRFAIELDYFFSHLD